MIVPRIDQPTITMMAKWYSMMRRCYLPEDSSYIFYGARGIRVCSEWLEFQSFLSFWGPPPWHGATIGRINNDGHYEPSNCEWQTMEQQNNNTRRSRLVTWNGKTQSIRDWAHEFNIGTRRLSERLRRGWGMERALNTPCPLSFAAELEDRRRRNAETWRRGGRRYRQASLARRAHEP